MPKPNYRQAKRQKELARKARQNEKEQRRQGRNPPRDGEAPADRAPQRST